MSTTFFQMRSFNAYNLDALINNQIYISHPSNLNDPYESFNQFCSDNDKELLNIVSGYLINESDNKQEPFNLPEWISYEIGAVDYNEKDDSYTYYPPYFSSLYLFATARVKSKSNFNKHLASELEKNNFNKELEYIRIINNIGISCFNQDYKLTNMWAYYGNNHKGYAVEYEFDKDALKEQSLHLTNVNHSLEKMSELNIKDKNLEETILDSLSKKTEHWTGEKETRIISLNGTNKLIDIPGKIISITFGLYMPDHEKKIIQKLLAGRNIAFKKLIFSKIRPEFMRITEKDYLKDNNDNDNDNDL